MKKHFSKNLIMTEGEEEQVSQVTCVGFVKDNSDEKVKDHCHVTGKFKGVAHQSHNINLQLTKKVPVIFHNLRGYDSHLIFYELKNFDVKNDVIPNGSEKHMTFILSKNLVFIDSMQFTNSGLEKLVKNLPDHDFKFLTQEFGFKNLKLLKQKDAYPYEYMNMLNDLVKKNYAIKNFLTAL